MFMRLKSFIIISILFFVYACNSDKEMKIDESKKSFFSNVTDEKMFNVTEQEAIATLRAFVEGHDGKTKVKSGSEPLKIVSSRKKSSLEYGNVSKFDLLKNSEDAVIKDVPIYEFTISENENEYGYALVGGDKRFDDVIAYVPNGSIADTMYNEGLADYIRLIPMMMSVSVHYDYWEPEINGSYKTVPDSYQFIKNTSSLQECYDWPTYGDWNYWENPTCFVPTKWEQSHPYNLHVNSFPCNDGVRSKIGCAAVALGQLMAYHKQPTGYDWDLLTATKTISPNASIFAKQEVARLLINLAIELKTVYGCSFDRPVADRTKGTSQAYDVIPAFAEFGYSCSENQIKIGVSGDTIFNNIINKRPVLCAAFGPPYGHIFIIDGIYRKYRDKFYFRTDYSTPADKRRYEIYKVRECFATVHINWGWAGSSDGWYYSFAPADNPYSWLGAEKTLFTQIAYKKK